MYTIYMNRRKTHFTFSDLIRFIPVNADEKRMLARMAIGEKIELCHWEITRYA